MYHCLMDIDRVVGLPINFPYEWVVTVTLAMCGYVFLRGDSCCCKDGLDVCFSKDKSMDSFPNSIFL